MGRSIAFMKICGRGGGFWKEVTTKPPALDNRSLSQTTVAVIGGGLAGLAAAAALASEGFSVDIHESRTFLGGRATSWPAGGEEMIDNCQHVLLRCCVNLLDLYRRLDVERDITFHKEFFFIEPGGRLSKLKAGGLPRPFHFSSSFLKMSCLNLTDKLGLARALLAL